MVNNRSLIVMCYQEAALIELKSISSCENLNEDSEFVDASEVAQLINQYKESDNDEENIKKLNEILDSYYRCINGLKKSPMNPKLQKAIAIGKIVLSFVLSVLAAIGLFKYSDKAPSKLLACLSTLAGSISAYVSFALGCVGIVYMSAIKFNELSDGYKQTYAESIKYAKQVRADLIKIIASLEKYKSKVKNSQNYEKAIETFKKDSADLEVCIMRIEFANKAYKPIIECAKKLEDWDEEEKKKLIDLITETYRTDFTFYVFLCYHAPQEVHEVIPSHAVDNFIEEVYAPTYLR